MKNLKIGETTIVKSGLGTKFQGPGVETKSSGEREDLGKINPAPGYKKENIKNEEVKEDK